MKKLLLLFISMFYVGVAWVLPKEIVSEILNDMSVSSSFSENSNIPKNETGIPDSFIVPSDTTAIKIHENDEIVSWNVITHDGLYHKYMFPDGINYIAISNIRMSYGEILRDGGDGCKYPDLEGNFTFEFESSCDLYSIISDRYTLNPLNTAGAPIEINFILRSFIDIEYKAGETLLRNFRVDKNNYFRFMAKTAPDAKIITFEDDKDIYVADFLLPEHQLYVDEIYGTHFSSVQANEINAQCKVRYINPYIEICGEYMTNMLEISVYDLSGRIVISVKRENDTIVKVDCSGLEKGIYVAVVRGKGVEYKQKIAIP